MADKYKKLKRQVSTDGGRAWQDMIPYEYIAGELIERDSPDCNNVEWRTVSGYICEENTTEMTQWVADTGYVCVGFDKYNKEKEQVSYNSGISWADTGNTRAGSTLIEQNSVDCGYAEYRWVADTGYVCVGYDKYNKEKEQMSTDGGSTWTDTGNTRAGSTLIETDSTDCGYVPPTPANAKATITYANGDTYDVPLNGSSELTQSEIRRGLDDTSPYFYWNIKSVVILNTVTSIGSSAFYWCREMTSVTVPSTVTTIGQQAFDNCYSLTSVNVPSGVSQIGYNTFHNCRALTSIAIPSTVTTIGNQAFYGCSGMTSFTIPNNVTSIGYSAFSSCTSLAAITIPNSVTTIGQTAFSDCSRLTSITIPGSVTTIGDSIFDNCTSLNTVTIVSQSLTMGDYIISGCTSLASLTMMATTPPSMGWLYSTPPEMPLFNIYVPSGYVNTYKAASGWSRYSSQISAITT